MAHFAKIDESNNVLAVLTMKDILNEAGEEDESTGQAYLEKHNLWPAHLWLRTSYNTHGNSHASGDNSKAFRGNFAIRGGIWDPVNEIFMESKKYASWTLDVATAKWVSPKGPRPTPTIEQAKEFRHYDWDEAAQDWTLTPANPDGPFDDVAFS